MQAPSSLIAAGAGAHQLAEFVRLLPIGAAMLDENLAYIAASRYWVTTFKIAEPFIGSRHLDVFDDISEQWRLGLEEGLEGKPSFSDCDSYQRSDGVLQYVKWKIDPWRRPSGDIGGIFVFSEDITDQVLTRQRLREKEAHLANLFEHSPIGFNLCRMDGLWLESNKAFLDIIGYSTEEASSLTYWDLTPRKYDGEEAQQLESLSKTRRYGPYEKEFIRKDGSLIPVRLNGFIVERDNEEFIWSLIEDIQQRKDLENALEQERLAALQASKLATIGQLAAGIAHEINNPLAIIESFTDVLEDAIGDDPALVDESLAALRNAVQRASHIVNGLLRFARGAGSTAQREASPEELIDNVMSLIGSRFSNHGIDVEIETRATRLLQCNPIEFSQVLLNILTNAYDAVRDRTDRWIKVEVEDTGDDAVVFRITNSGARVAPEIVENIFDPFFTTKAVGAGTGLGLSISKGIVEALGGTLTLDASSPHTQFVLTVPTSRGCR